MKSLAHMCTRAMEANNASVAIPHSICVNDLSTCCSRLEHMLFSLPLALDLWGSLCMMSANPKKSVSKKPSHSGGGVCGQEACESSEVRESMEVRAHCDRDGASVGSKGQGRSNLEVKTIPRWPAKNCKSLASKGQGSSNRDIRTQAFGV